MSENIYTITPEQANAIREDCREKITLSDRLKRLENNTDFKEFVKYYTEDNAARLVGLLGERTFNMDEKKQMYRDDIHEQMIGVARFKEFCGIVHQLATQAEKTLDDLNNATIEG